MGRWPGERTIAKPIIIALALVIVISRCLHLGRVGPVVVIVIAIIVIIIAVAILLHRGP